jgi:tryptophan-rich sensory protein
MASGLADYFENKMLGLLIGQTAFWLGAVIILVMDVLVWLTIVKFKDVDIWAARLLIPYEAWLWIASTHNIYLALNN